MAIAQQIFWRCVGDSEFVCVERSPENTPKTGGGQTYFSVIFGEHLDKEEFGRFLGVVPPSRIVTERPSVPISAAVLGGSPARLETIEFRPRYRNPEDLRRDRYYIARQNRQRLRQTRHPAWTAERGFPEAPDDIADRDDPRMPDLSQLKLIVVRADDGSYFADFVNADHPPEGAPAELSILFEANDDAPPDGLIALEPPGLPIEALAALVRSSRRRRDRDRRPTSPEVEDARDMTARLAGARRRRGGGQGFRQSAEERIAIDAHAMAIAIEHFESCEWNVEDRSADHSYDLFCERGGEELHVEVKGTTSDGSAVLLTPNEVEFARANSPRMALLIVHGMQLSGDEDGKPVVGGGEIELIEPWEIDSAGTLKPTGFGYELS